MSSPSPALIAALADSGLAEHAALLAPFATLEIALVAADAPPQPGGSRIGGDPDVPAGFAWPCHRWPLAEVAGWPDWAQRDVAAARAQGQVYDESDALVMPLPFLAQLDLAALAPLDPRLPDHGLLLCFASVTTDVADPRYAKRVAAAVAHVDGPLAPHRHPPTTDPPPARTIALTARRAIAWDIPYEQLAELQQQLPAASHALLTAGPGHALFPAPRDECAGPMPPPGEIALLRLAEDDRAGWSVGDATWVTFAIDAADLAAHRFDQARASVYIG